MFSFHPALFAATLELLSKPASSDLGAPASGHSTSPTFSPDGGYLLFNSAANDLLNAPINSAYDVFIRSMTNASVRQVSVSSNNAAPNGDALVGGISRDNRYVVFQSLANNLAAGDTNSVYDIYIRDLVAGTNGIVSRGATAIGNGRSAYPQISQDGHWVVFQTAANNLGLVDTNQAPDIYAWHRDDGAIKLVSAAAAGGTRDISGLEFYILPDSASVLFLAAGPNLVSGAAGTSGQVYMRNLTNNALTFVSGALSNISGLSAASSLKTVPSGDGRFALIVAFSVTTSQLVRVALSNLTATLVSTNVLTPTPTLQQVTAPSISDNGQYVAFVSGANATSPRAIYRWNAATTQTEQADVGGTTSTSVGSEMPVISPDGSLVAFASSKANLVAGLTNSFMRLYVRDFTASATRLVSRDINGDNSGFSGAFGSLTFAPNNGALLFESAAAEFTAGDSYGSLDIFQWTKSTAALTLISSNNFAAGSAILTGPSSGNSASGDGRYVAFQSLARINRNDTNYNYDVYAYDRVAKTNYLISRLPSGFAPSNGVSKTAFVSRDGAKIAFETSARALGGASDTRAGNIYVHDLQTHANAPVIPAGLSGSFSFGAFSDDGQYIFAPNTLTTPGLYRFNPQTSESLLFASGAGLLLTSISSNSQSAAYLATNNTVIYDFAVGSRSGASNVAFISKNGAIVLSTTASSTMAFSNRLTHVETKFPITNSATAMSADGRIVAYIERYTTNGLRVGNVCYLDTLTGKTNLVSRRYNSSQIGNDNSEDCFISLDGRFIGFESASSDLVQNDNNGCKDVFVYDRFTDKMILASARPDGSSGGGSSYNGFFSADSSAVFFKSSANDLVSDDVNDGIDLFALNLDRTIPTLDSDADGLPDAWELANFSSLEFGAADDFDSDGMSNLQEFTAGTDPTNPASLFIIRSATVQPDRTRKIIWSGVPGRNYQPEVRTSLSSGAWINLGNVITATAGDNVTLDTNTIVSQQYYRIRSTP